MSNVFVLGGTRFFGKQLVELLLREGHTVTIGTRGKTPDPFGEQVTRVVVDRENRESLNEAAAGGTWDVVFDNIGYSPRSALDACEAFAGRTRRYIFTSTMAVYEQDGHVHPETDFDPYTYPFQPEADRAELPYGEGKRQAEAALFQTAPFPVCAVRFPIVMGTDDYTGRLRFHVEHIADGKPMGVPDPEARMSYIPSGEAGEFLYWLGFSELEGPFNAAASGDYSVKELLAYMEEAVGKEAVVVRDAGKENQSPYGIPASWLMDLSKASESGFSFSKLDDWLPELIRTVAGRKAQSSE